jgi:hypothetical protein
LPGFDARPFKSIEDVKRVKGIKEGEFSKIKDLITVEGCSDPTADLALPRPGKDTD